MVANLSSANEVPPIAGLNATGRFAATLTVNRDAAGAITGGSITFQGNVNFPGAVVVRGLHIHEQVAGQNGPIRFDSGLTAANPLTFANGMVAKERIVDVDDQRRRVAYTVLGDMFEHHSAAMEIVSDGPERCRFVWTTDLLPDERVQTVAPLVEQGVEALVRTLESQPATAKA